MRVLVCGGRKFDDRWWLYAGLQLLHNQQPITDIIEGGAAGADSLARDWARSRGIRVTTVRADWEKYGRAAGAIRNGEMAKLEPDIVFVCPGGVGTALMVSIAKSRKLRTVFLEKMPVVRTDLPAAQEVPLLNRTTRL